MGRTPKDVTEAELAVLRQLWETGPSTIRALADALYGPGGGSAYATVQKLLERLEKKRFVVRRRPGGAHVFRALVRREELVGRRLREVADQLCDGSVAPLLTGLVNARGLKSDHREALRRIIEDLDEQGRARP